MKKNSLYRFSAVAQNGKIIAESNFVECLFWTQTINRKINIIANW